MALWRVLDIYKRADSRRGQAHAENQIDTVKWNAQSRAKRGVLAKPLGVRPENCCRLFWVLRHNLLLIFRGINRPFRDRDRAIRTRMDEYLLNCENPQQSPKNALYTALFAKAKPKPNFSVRFRFCLAEAKGFAPFGFCSLLINNRLSFAFAWTFFLV